MNRKLLRRCSVSLVIWEIQTKNHTIPHLMKWLQPTGNPSVGKELEKLEPSHVADRMAPWKALCQFIKVLTTELLYD